LQQKLQKIAHIICLTAVLTLPCGQFCFSFVANLLQHLCAKNCQNTMRFDKVIAKITRNRYASPPEGNAIPTGPLSDSEEKFVFDRFIICLFSLVKF